MEKSLLSVFAERRSVKCARKVTRSFAVAAAAGSCLASTASILSTSAPGACLDGFVKRRDLKQRLLPLVRRETDPGDVVLQGGDLGVGAGADPNGGVADVGSWLSRSRSS